MAVVEISAADFPGSVLNGSGSDTLKLVGSGTFDFAYVTFAGFSSIECDSGTIEISGSQLNGKAGVLKKTLFYSGLAAHDRDDRIIYNSKTGALSYDQDGTGAAKAIQIATLPKKLALKYTDLIVI